MKVLNKLMIFMNLINRVFAKFGKKKVIITVVLVVAVSVYYFGFSHTKTTTEATIVTIPEVTVSPVRALSGDVSFSTVGTVQAVSEAQLHVEAGGRVVAVYPKLGDAVQAGAIITQLDGAVQSAAMLQAQGAYEAALAGAAQGGVGISEAQNGVTAAQNGAVTTYKNAYTTVSGIVFTSIDQFFADPNAPVPGMRLGNGKYAASLNADRVSLQTTLPAWQTQTTTLTTASDLNGALTNASATTKQVIAMVDTYIEILNSNDVTNTYTDAEIRGYISSFTAVRAQLSGTLAAIDGAKTGLAAANDGLSRAQIASTGSGSVVSSSDAQVKIALGSLRAAQAAYEKTVVRTPITGVVNALYLKAGEYATPGAQAAIVANNKGLEIETSVSQEDSLQLQVGDKVTIDGTATGTISAIAGAIDPTTGKVALKVSVNENGTLQNGSTVAIAFASSKKTTATDITIPLAAVKMTGSGPVVFTVDTGASTLVAQPIVLGAISGASVVVASGLTADTAIVTDGRGLKEGEKVTVATK
jgi:multidrug efflux pump subunit AcrA (membrane-fusion protein)